MAKTKKPRVTAAKTKEKSKTASKAAPKAAGKARGGKAKAAPRKAPSARTLAPSRKKATKAGAARTGIPAKPKPQPQAARPYGLPEQLRDAALKVLDARQAEEVVTVDLVGRSSVADYLIIASGRASRQLAAIADYIRAAFAELGVRQLRVEGLPEANWVLVDSGDVIVHLFRSEVRRYYDLDAIWADKPAAE